MTASVVSLQDRRAAEPAETATLVTREQAETITQNLRNALERAYGLIEHAYKVRCDIAMGYESWAAYVSAEFGPDGLAVPKSERSKVIALFDVAGMSQRAIASATGVSKDTVNRALNSSVSNETVDSDSPATKTGLDGKERAARKPSRSQNPPEDSDEKSSGTPSARRTPKCWPLTNSSIEESLSEAWAKAP